MDSISDFALYSLGKALYTIITLLSKNPTTRFSAQRSQISCVFSCCDARSISVAGKMENWGKSIRLKIVTSTHGDNGERRQKQ
ncbi:unnamed protein product [Sphenostylis stenocarpa]|uniref:Uncharacterized protein n=1 Tax=Sphenostylis stenocarpa TaxID=92480 RepID=A0AA86VJM1_9FABA|nr:unnamed protein product [Sphenostylis stenocarpa]